MSTIEGTRTNLPDIPTTTDGGHQPLARVFAVGVAVAAVIVAAILGSGSFALWRLVEARSVAAEVGTPGLLTGQRLMVALLDQETGVRGYATTGNGAFLEPYTSGMTAERDAVATLRPLATRGVTDFGPALEGVEAAMGRWRSDYAEPALSRAPDQPAPEVGKELFDQVRTGVETLVAGLEAQRTVMAGRVNDATNFLIAVSIAIAAVLVAFMVATGIGLRRAVLIPVSDLAAQVRGVVAGGVQSGGVQPGGEQRSVRATGPREIVELGEDVEAMRAYIVRDLDEATDRNRRLDEQARDLERSNRDLEQFAYVASHDLQEPLRKVSSFCQLLQRRYGGKLDDRADQYIEFAVDGAQRMQQLINDLLAFSRVGRTTQGFGPVDLATVAGYAVAQLEPARAEVDGRFEIGELPVVLGDASLLRQLLVNLLGNGLKFHRDGVPPVVRMDAEPIGAGSTEGGQSEAERITERWRLRVSDNGIGIEPEYADKVFVIFQRLHARDSYAGTGIGLALAKKIVEFHDGRIDLVTTPGPGATIEFTLPATTPAISEEPSP